MSRIYQPAKDIKKALKLKYEPKIYIKSVIQKRINRRRVQFDNGFLIEVVNNKKDDCGLLYQTQSNNIADATAECIKFIERYFIKELVK